jgi:hypothetical protein
MLSAAALLCVTGSSSITKDVGGPAQRDAGGRLAHSVQSCPPVRHLTVIAS